MVSASKQKGRRLRMNKNVHEWEQGDAEQMNFRIILKHHAFRKAGLLILLAALSTMAIYAHLQITRATIDYRGSLALWDRAFDLLLAVAVISVAFCVGHGVCRILKLDFVSHAEEVAYPVMLGVGALGLGLLGL